MSSGRNQLGAILDRMDYGRALKGELLMNGKPDSWVPYAQPLLDAVALFAELNIGYALIGAIAAMYYGRSRFTEDVDFVVSGIGVPPMETIGETPILLNSGFQIDLWNDEHANEIIERAVDVALAGKPIHIIEPHDLIAMKLRAGRLKDDYDISQIVLTTAIDETRLATLISTEQFVHFSEIRKRLQYKFCECM
jgi:hypothetical protein